MVILVEVNSSTLLEDLLSERLVGGLDGAENVLLRRQWVLS